MTAVPPGWTPEQARKRLEAATPGPWEWDDDWENALRAGSDYVLLGMSIASEGTLSVSEADAAFIANAPTDIAALLALLDEAREALAVAPLVMREIQRLIDEGEHPTAAKMTAASYAETIDSLLSRLAAPKDEA